MFVKSVVYCAWIFVSQHAYTVLITLTQPCQTTSKFHCCLSTGVLKTSGRPSMILKKGCILFQSNFVIFVTSTGESTFAIGDFGFKLLIGECPAIL